MTVIAFRAGILAADQMVYNGELIVGEVDKIGRTEDGWLYGATGHTALLRKFAEWAEHREGDPESYDGEHSDLILISPEGEVREWIGEGWCVLKTASFRAWGCGSDVAVGAMAFGADAVTACQIAVSFNTHCGGEITCFALDAIEHSLPDLSLPMLDATDDDGSAMWTEALRQASPEDTAPLDAAVPGWRERLGLR